jgi:hypothetical protein
MHLESGDGYVLDDGRCVRIGSIYDRYTAYDTDTQMGTNPETRVRFSHWWSENKLVAARDLSVTDFCDCVEQHVPASDLPENQSPTAESHW